MRSLLELPDEYVRPEWKTCAVPGRPWWRLVPFNARSNTSILASLCWVRDRYGVPGRMVRMDGAEVFREVEISDTRKFGHGSEEDFTWVADVAGTPEACAAYDAEHPLPHPSVRVGQIWLYRERPFLYSLTERDNEPRWRSCLVSGFDSAPPDEHGAFLLHDPLRPDLAPWSSR